LAPSKENPFTKVDGFFLFNLVYYTFFFLYSLGDIPVCFLNMRLKYSELSYPTADAICVML